MSLRMMILCVGDSLSPSLLLSLSPSLSTLRFLLVEIYFFCSVGIAYGVLLSLPVCTYFRTLIFLGILWLPLFNSHTIVLRCPIFFIFFSFSQKDNKKGFTIGGFL